eukprot:366013-Chlamydomonas_euryale.AAC.1
MRLETFVTSCARSSTAQVAFWRTICRAAAQVSALLVGARSLADLHHERRRGACKVLQQRGVERRAQVVRVGHKEVLHAVAQQAVHHAAAQQR